eukprot:3421691-Rhodomonas_salina.1
MLAKRKFYMAKVHKKLGKPETARRPTAFDNTTAPPPEIQHKKPHFQDNLYHECGFLYLISQGRRTVPHILLREGVLR